MLVTMQEIANYYEDIHRRARLRIAAQTQIRKLSHEGKSFKQIKEYLNKNFPTAKQQAYVNDKMIHLYMK